MQSTQKVFILSPQVDQEIFEFLAAESIRAAVNGNKTKSLHYAHALSLYRVAAPQPLLLLSCAVFHRIIPLAVVLEPFLQLISSFLSANDVFLLPQMYHIINLIMTQSAIEQISSSIEISEAIDSCFINIQQHLKAGIKFNENWTSYLEEQRGCLDDLCVSLILISSHFPYHLCKSSIQ